MKKLIFEPSDFPYYIEKSGEKAAAAKSKFDAWFKENIESAPVIYHDKELDDVWTTDRHLNDTHTARLVDIRKIKKECKHEGQPKFLIGSDIIKYVCKSCNVELSPEWKEVKL